MECRFPGKDVGLIPHSSGKGKKAWAFKVEGIVPVDTGVAWALEGKSHSVKTKEQLRNGEGTQGSYSLRESCFFGGLSVGITQKQV